ncbi:PAS domain S-box protein [Rariglobus hedericola]|uniref:histidine kinase n=1 Tax=Rariglobus hedericola TaxID=2597822 RepID=A0A556QGU6_9BACT|nr:PAS domain S-box protein [Rariglobus hedericola]TSJ75851.1 PAS domain S-box protein [Rariglobus hedericola]
MPVFPVSERRSTHVFTCSLLLRRICLILIIAFGAAAAPAAPDEPVTLWLKWRHQFQFAGYYAAQAKGYYADEGIYVRIEPGRPGMTSADAVLHGVAQFGVNDSDVVLARLQGKPFVVCAAIFQHSPLVILSRRDRNIRTPADLAGGQLMMSDRQSSAQLWAMFMREGISTEKLRVVPHTWRLEDLIEGRVDAVSAYATVEPPKMRALGIEPAILRAIDYGVDFYGDLLFTSEREVREHPERTRAFIQASLKGWDYAMRHPEEIADYILALDDVKARGITRENLLAEASAMKPFILPDVVEIGHMNPGRFRQIAQTFFDLKMAPAGASLDGFIYTPPAPGGTLTRTLLFKISATVAFGVLVVLLWNLQIRRRVNRRTLDLKKEVLLRAQVETELRASEERFRLMFAGAATGIAVTTPDGRFTQANPSYLTSIGYTEAELQKLNLVSLLHPDDQADYRKLIENLLAGDRDHFVSEARCMKKDGRFAWKRAGISLVRTKDGQPASIIVVAEDITARREAEESASASAELLRMAGGIGGMGAWSIAFPGSRITWSDEVYRIHEVNTTYRPSWEKSLAFFTPDSRRLLAAAIDAGEPYDFELELITAKGNRRWVRTTSNTEREEGVLKRIYGIFQDITDRKLAREKLAASEAQYRLLFTHNPLPMWVCEAETLRFLAVNTAACEHYGYTDAEFVSMTITDLRVPGAAANTERHRKKNGSLIDIEMSSDKIVFDGRNAFLTMAHDVTELARVNRAQRMLSACNEALIRTEAENDLLNDICRIAVEIGGYRMAWVGFAMQDAGKTVRPVAHAGAEHGYLAEIEPSWDENVPTGRGPAGRTIRSGQAVFCDDIDKDGSFGLSRSLARKHGSRSVICLPLRDETRTRGLLSLHSSDILVVGTDEITLLQQLADDLAFGLNIIRARVERRKTQEAVFMMARSVSAAIGGAFFDQLTESMVAALGADVGVVAMIDPANPALARTLSVIVDGHRRKNFAYPLSGAPCELTVTGQSCVVERDAQQRFPASRLMADLRAQAYVGHPLITAAGEPVGVMAVLFHRPLEQTDFIASTLQIFATRASSELERQQVDSRLREQAALLDKAQDAILVRDLDHHITFWNKSAERLYGWTAEEAIDRSIAELLYEDPTAFLEATQHVITKGEWVGELQQINKQRLRLNVECRWTLVRDDSGTPSAILAINTDITEKKKLEHQFLRAQRMESIGTLAGGIAHDLNNVLAPVIMAIDLLKLNERDALKLSLLKTVETSARRGADMVGQVLSFARGMEGRRVDVQLKHVIHDIEKISQDTFPKNIQISATVDSALWPLMGDPTQLHQVLLNLCVNARDAMPDGGRLTILAENIHLDAHYAAMNIEAKAGPHVAIEVEDTGTGIPQDIIDKIFDPFFTTKEVGKGTGLGLSTSIAIIKGHEGFIRVYSEPGKGTRFRVYIPAKPSADSPALTAEANDLPRGHGELVLVVDDEASIRDITQQTLETFGYRVISAADGAEAVALYSVQRERIAVVLTDMMMPVMDGAATIQALTRINPHIHIIAASGITANGDVAKAAGSGVRHFLPKPYTAGTLLKVLRQVLQDAPL